ncbi:MAG: DNA cytosine methyltransferase, partial [Turicibacter sanguinis]
MTKLKVASLFAGVGGICTGFKNAGADVVWANEIDPYAAETYKLNMPNTNLVVEDIHKINTSEVVDFDILTSGFPCQAFSIAGYRKGFEDERGNLFFETLRFIIDKQPKAFLLENVKNLVSHDNGKTFEIMKEALISNGYHIKYQV